MNQMMHLGNPEKTMSSREIAELTGKQHSNVLRDIREMLDKIHGLVDDSNLNHQEIQGVTVERDNRGYILLANLDKDHTLTLLTGYSTKARYAVVKRWQELEAQQQAFQIPQTKAEALRLAADLAEQVEQQQALIEHQKPAVEFVGRYVEAAGTMTFREVAKVLGLKRHELRQLEAKHRVMYQLNGRWVPYQHQIDAGRFTVKTGSADNGHAFAQARYTPKGVEYLAKLAGLEVAA